MAQRDSAQRRETVAGRVILVQKEGMVIFGEGAEKNPCTPRGGKRIVNILCCGALSLAPQRTDNHTHAPARVI